MKLWETICRKLFIFFFQLLPDHEIRNLEIKSEDEYIIKFMFHSYNPPYIKVLLETIVELGITPLHPISKKELISHLMKKGLTRNLARAAVTLIRAPYLGIEGNYIPTYPYSPPSL